MSNAIVNPHPMRVLANPSLRFLANDNYNKDRDTDAYSTWAFRKRASGLLQNYSSCSKGVLEGHRKFATAYLNTIIPKYLNTAIPKYSMCSVFQLHTYDLQQQSKVSDQNT